ncbi:MAG: hydrogenase maturation protease [Acidobacteria bacterium]|nr:hydrogenase maturation protease [Acidobacteriota bacterium]
MFDIQTDNTHLSTVNIGDATFRVGSRVRLLPRAGGDIFDVALQNKSAVIESIERDFEDNIHLAVVLDDDPGKDIGMMRHVGHRFFFRPDEVALLPEKRILIAGIGNIFLGDDGFGVAVAQQLLQREITDNICVRDFGIRGFDLAMKLAENYDVVILVDAMARGGNPGDVYWLDLDLHELENHTEITTHELTPLRALALGTAFGAIYQQVFIVGCEPLNLDEGMGLSEPIWQAIPEAISLIDSLANKICRQQKSLT